MSELAHSTDIEALGLRLQAASRAAFAPGGDPQSCVTLDAAEAASVAACLEDALAFPELWEERLMQTWQINELMLRIPEADREAVWVEVETSAIAKRKQAAPGGK